MEAILAITVPFFRPGDARLARRAHRSTAGKCIPGLNAYVLVFALPSIAGTAATAPIVRDAAAHPRRTGWSGFRNSGNIAA